MKRILAITTLVFVFSITSCFNDFTIPQKVEVSTNAKYNFTVADVDYSLANYFEPSSIISNIGDSFEVYDYNPGANQSKQSFLLRIPIQEIPLDFSSYLSSTDFGNLISTMNFEQEVTIPSISVNQTKPVDLIVINNAINTMVTFTGPITGSFIQQKVNFAAGFTSVSYDNGKVVISASVSGEVKLYSGPNDTAAKSTLIASGNMDGGTATLDISGKKLYSEYTYISFENAGSSFVGTIDPDSTIIRAEGITQGPISIPQLNYSFPIASAGSGLESCQIDTGSLVCQIITGWEGVTLAQSLDFTGGLNFNMISSTKNLAGETFNNQDIDVEANCSIEFNNATVDFSKTPNIKIQVDISQIASAVIALPAGTNTSISVNQNLPAEASSMITQIDWKSGCGIKIDYTNTFPTGNDFALSSVTSSFLGLSSQPTKTLNSNTTDGSISFLTSTDYQCPITSSTQVDFTANLDLPGSTPNKIVVQNVVPGNTYKIKLKITPILDWDKLYLNSSLLNANGSTCMDFNLASIFGNLDSTFGCNISNKIRLKSLPIHLFCEIPNLSVFNNPSFNGKIRVFLADSTGTLIGSNENYILGSASSNAQMPLVSEPALVKNQSGVVTSVVSGGLSSDLASILNASATNPSSQLGISYNLSLTTGSSSSLIIDHSTLGSNANTTIKIAALIILPFEFDLIDDVNLNIMNMLSSIDTTDPNWDVLRRTGPTDVTDLQKFLDIIESVSISYSPTKKPFISSNEINLILDMDGSGSTFATQSLSLNGGRYSENPSDLLNTYPLQPQVELELKAGTLSIPRDIGIKTKIDLTINTNGEPITIWGGQ